MYLKYVFIIFALMLSFMISFYKIKLQNQKQNSANFLSVLTAVYFLYVLSAFILVFFVQGIISKFIILIFAFSPFIIGKFATFQKESVYSIIQILCAIISAGYVYIN